MCSQVPGFEAPGRGAEGGGASFQGLWEGGLCYRVWWGDSSLSPPLPAGVCQVFAEALQADGVRFTRLPAERGVGSCAWLEAPARAFACTVERDARAAMGPFSRHGLR